MAGPVLTALASLPWTTILKQAPVLLAAARGLDATLRPPPPPLGPDADIQALRERIAGLEAAQEEHARLLSQLTEHVARLTVATDAAVTLCRRAMLAGIAGLAVAVLALIVVWLR